MNQRYIEISIDEILPADDTILSSLYETKFESPDSSVVEFIHDAKNQFKNIAKPMGIIRPISKTEFSNIYVGIGLNASVSPLETIFHKSDFLHLFAATIGSNISEKITDYFDQGDYLKGYLLNSIASIATDQISEYFENIVTTKNNKTLSYSPGYCGWHVSGQHTLFQFLNTKIIGITLNEHALMTPVKSVSGVLVSGKPDIHKFKPSFPFCKHCRDHSCIPRMK